jgi:long-chain acyl-CoA synthetase
MALQSDSSSAVKDYKQVGDVTIAIGKGKPEQGDRKAVGPIYRNIAAKDGWPKIQGASTLYELFEQSVKQHPNARCIGWRPMKNGQAQDYVFHTYKGTQERVQHVASAMQQSNIKPHYRVGMYAANCPEWMLVLQACNRTGSYCVPLYDSLGESSVEYIINHAEASIIFTSNEKFPLLGKALPATKKNVKTVVYFGDETDAAKKAAQAAEKEGVKVYSFSDFEKLGEGKPAKPTPPKPEDPACIMYTSGTTGNPKGVMLTHNNLISAVGSLRMYVEQGNIVCGPDDSHLSYLTLAHILDRVVEEFALSVGAHIGYWQGDVKKLTEDIGALRPTLFVAVPRVLDRMKSGIESIIKKQGPVAQLVFKLAFMWKRFWRRLGWINNLSPLADTIVFNKVRSKFGGKVRFVVSGGAPLGAAAEEFLHISLCCPVLQGYGLTETCAASFLALPKPGHSGTVGPPVPGTELRLEGSSELGYNPLGSPPRGEICIRGPLVFQGYFKDEQKTKEAFDEEGWFHTGDVGEITSHGCLKVIDRLKNMFKLAQGEYVAAEKLESQYQDTPGVEQLWVYGNSYESFLVGVVVPNKHAVEDWAKENGVSGSYEEILKNDKTRDHYVEELTKVGKGKKLKGFELLKAVYLEPHEFSVDNDTMTPSMKLKRPQLQKRYQKEIDAMYKQANAKLGSR